MHGLFKYSRLGETLIMNNGLKATIVTNRRTDDIDIEFENGQKVFNRQYSNFKQRTIKCPMIYNFIDDYVECINPNVQPNCVFLIDIEDLDRIKGELCCYDDNEYIIFRCKVKLHRYLMNCPKDKLCDHKDGNPKNCRKSNLRICTFLENNKNIKLPSVNTTGYKGVVKDGEKWIAQIKCNYETKYLGRYGTKEEAAKVYNEAALKYHGEFARLNIIE